MHRIDHMHTFPFKWLYALTARKLRSQQKTQQEQLHSDNETALFRKKKYKLIINILLFML